MALITTIVIIALAGLQAVARELPSLRHNANYMNGVYGPYPTQEFYTVNYTVPRVHFQTWHDDACSYEDYYYVLAIQGELLVKGSWPVILDSQGNLVWTRQSEDISSFAADVQHIADRDYLVYFSGEHVTSHSRGQYHVLDKHYNELYKVLPHSNATADNHDFSFTSNNSVVFTSYRLVDSPWDLSQLNVGPEQGSLKPFKLWEGVFQEISVPDGRLLFEWSSLKAFPPDTMVINSFSLNDYQKSGGFDYFHINSVEKDAWGNYLVSSRYLSGLAYVSGATGEVLWVLGGKESNFRAIDRTSPFYAQHMARFMVPPTTNLTQKASTGSRGKAQVTLFDNGQWWGAHLRPSRGLHLELDFDEMTVRLIKEYSHPDNLWTDSRGSMTHVPALTAASHDPKAQKSNMVLGYGYVPAVAIFSETGHLLCDLRFGAMATVLKQQDGFTPNPWAKSYRGLLRKWAGYPQTNPDTAIVDGSLWVSWNGATEVRKWQLKTAFGARVIANVVSEKTMFETPLAWAPSDADSGIPVYTLIAWSKGGDVLGHWELDQDGQVAEAVEVQGSQDGPQLELDESQPLLDAETAGTIRPNYVHANPEVSGNPLPSTQGSTSSNGIRTPVFAGLSILLICVGFTLGRLATLRSVRDDTKVAAFTTMTSIRSLPLAIERFWNRSFYTPLRNDARVKESTIMLP